ncbi:MAG: hypothetical protein EDQ89_05920, partial [Acidobacteria bacterium]
MEPATEQAAAELSRRPPDPIRVGAGTAFYLGGTLPGRPAPGSLRLRVGDRSAPLDADSMPPERSYGAGGLWWSLVELPGP